MESEGGNFVYDLEDRIPPSLSKLFKRHWQESFVKPRSVALHLVALGGVRGLALWRSALPSTVAFTLPSKSFLSTVDRGVAIHLRVCADV